MTTDPHTQPVTAVLARLRAAYLEVALCETWLALDEARREEQRARSAASAAQAQARQRSLEEEERNNAA